MKHEYELAVCPICKAQPWIYEDIQDLHIVCSEDCPAPNCAHTHPRDVAMSWNDWVRWFRHTEESELMEQIYQSTGIQAFNGMMYVGDTVLYEDGWLTFTSQIVEVDGKFGFIIDDEFEDLSEPLIDPHSDIPGICFEIISTKARKSYPAVFSHNMGQEYAVFFPDLDVATSGTNEENAMKSAQELLKCVLMGFEEDGLPLPVATDLDKVEKEPMELVRLIIVE